MEARSFTFGTYNTANHGWLLTSWEFTEPALIENYIDVPGRLDGPLDASTALTNGDPRYGSRKLTATFECSEGTRSEREDSIGTMRDLLDGWKLGIHFPDYLSHHAKGRVRVERLYNDLAHASVRVTAICEPWLYSNDETVTTLTAKSSEVQEVQITNNGRRMVIPAVEISGASVGLNGDGDGGLTGNAHTLSSVSLSVGTYQLPDFYIGPGERFTLKYSGTGTIKLTYREAVL